MGEAVNEGVRIHYEIVGNGQPLLLHHGSPDDSSHWNRFGYVEPLSQRYRVLVMDARGHGKSDKPHDPKAYTLKSFVNDIVAVLDAAGIHQVHYWGYSFGAWVGFGLVTQQPQRVAKAILGGQHPYERNMPETDGSDPEQYWRTVTKRFGMDFDAAPAEERDRWLAMDTRALAAMPRHRASQEALLPRITTPCLMYAGDKDGLYAQAQQAAKAISNCQFVSVPGGHLEAYQNAPAILPTALKFLDGN
jgi:pimeloyl-ACP methyl ester carboxylesterase